MRIHVRCRGVADQGELLERARARAGVHLGGFGRALASAEVRVEDVNGPRGGVDKRCRVTVKGPRVGMLSATQEHAEAGAALELALQRVAHAVRRAVDRCRQRQTQRGAQAGGAVRSRLAAGMALGGWLVVSSAGCATVSLRPPVEPTQVHACGPAQRASAPVEVSRSLPPGPGEEHGVFESDRSGLSACRMAVRCVGAGEPEKPGALPRVGT